MAGGGCGRGGCASVCVSVSVIRVVSVSRFPISPVGVLPRASSLCGLWAPIIPTRICSRLCVFGLRSRESRRKGLSSAFLIELVNPVSLVYRLPELTYILVDIAPCSNKAAPVRLEDKRLPLVATPPNDTSVAGYVAIGIALLHLHGTNVPSSVAYTATQVFPWYAAVVPSIPGNIAPSPRFNVGWRLPSAGPETRYSSPLLKCRVLLIERVN